MSESEKTERLVNAYLANLPTPDGAEVDGKVLAEALTAMQQAKSQRAADTSRITWRTIMTSRAGKLAAAAVIVAAVLSLTVFDGLTRPAWALEDAIEAALNVTARQLANSGVEVVRDYRSAGRTMAADQGQLEQVFLNLFINATQAMRHGGELTVRSWFEVSQTGEEHVIVTVADTGSGIEPEHLPHIFDPYFTTKQSGTGLGLAIVHKIVEAHGGQVKIASTEEKGTTVSLILPAKEEE